MTSSQRLPYRVQHGLPKIALEISCFIATPTGSAPQASTMCPTVVNIDFKKKILDIMFYTVRTVHQNKFCTFVSLCKAIAPGWLSRLLSSAKSILHFWRFVANPTHSLSFGQNDLGVGLLTAAPLISTLTWVQVERGASRLQANKDEWIERT